MIVRLGNALSVLLCRAFYGENRTLCARAHEHRHRPFWRLWAAFWDWTWARLGEADHCAEQWRKWG